MTYQFLDYKPSDIKTGHLNMGSYNDPADEIQANSLYLTRKGQPWIGVMGEYHFSRDHRENWYQELCKMKAGGVNIIATYIFWIYHEEEEGIFDWSGDLDLHAFLEETRRAGMDVVLRIGPWAHGECRNGGFPDWLLEKGLNIRTNDPAYLAEVRIFFEEIYKQSHDFFKEEAGGNVIAIQLENELVDNEEHIATLKEMALDIGFRAPLYTVTGWNSVTGARIPVNEVLPLFGSYAALPWAEGTGPLAPSVHYTFTGMRNDTAIGADLIAQKAADGWTLPYNLYPYATCETGAGIEPTHHRRPIMKPMDSYAMSLVKLGDGNNLIGYYMYHGGINKIGAHSTFNETISTGYPNDYPIRSYDFQAPLSEYGEIRDHYRLLNLLHLFVADFGSILAPMEQVKSTCEVSPEDTTSLRYCMRTDGQSGFIFVNHYQRLGALKDLTDVVFDTGSVTFPAINVTGESAFILPFNIKLSDKNLDYATSQLLCHVGKTYYFVALPGIEPSFSIDGKIYDSITIGPESGIEVDDITIVTLSLDQALYARKLGEDLYIGDGVDLIELDGEVVPADFNLGGDAEVTLSPCSEAFPLPYPDEMQLFNDACGEGAVSATVDHEPRAISWYKLSVSSDTGFATFDMPCDVAQIYADGQLVHDIFYYGKPWRVPASELYGAECYLVTSEMRDDFYREF